VAGRHVHDRGDDRTSSGGLGYHAAYQGKWHLSANIGEAKKAVDASLLTNRKIIDSYGSTDFLRVGDLIDGPLGGYSFDNFSAESAVTWLRTKAAN
jgi:hypothetical protein